MSIYFERYRVECPARELSRVEIAMAKKPKHTDSKSNPSSRNETRNNISLQTEDFLKLGGTIQRIPNGVSGQVWKPQMYKKSNKDQS